MKKLSILLLLITLSTNANAAYLGADLQFNNLSLKDPTSTLSIKSDDYYQNKSFAPSLFVGTYLNDSFSIELSYTEFKEEKENESTGLVYTAGPLSGSALTTKSTIGARLLSFDTVQHYQIKGTGFEITTGLGLTLAQFSFKEKFNNGSSFYDRERGFGINLGLGAGYELNRHASLRLRAKYILLNGIEPSKINGVGEVENIFSIGLGFQVKL